MTPPCACRAMPASMIASTRRRVRKPCTRCCRRQAGRTGPRRIDSELILRTATAEDAESIRILLERAGLPTSDLTSSKPEFIVACEDAELIGTGALQRFETIALLRSVAVTSGRRGGGIGRFIVQELERRARAAHVTQLVLLTQTAQRFFEHQGYRALERHSVPQAVQASEEFRSLCPTSATCMSKTLARGPRLSA